jgi:hypothetical protein
MEQPMQHQANQSMQNLLEQTRIADEASAWVGAVMSKPMRLTADQVQAAAAAFMAQPMQQQPSLAAQQALPYLAVPRDRPVRTEVEILRDRVAAMEAQIVALTPPEPAPVPNPMTRAVSRWPGSVGFMQGLRWRGA